MELKSFAFGIVTTILLIAAIGGAIAAIAPEGSVINVPMGKFAIYHFVKNDDSLRVRDSVRYWEGDSTITTTEAIAKLSNKVKEFIQEYVWSAEANIAAEAAINAALNNTGVGE